MIVVTTASGAAPFAERAIIEQAESLLRNSLYPALKNVSCDYRQGKLFLRGHLPTYYLKQRAQEAIAGVPCVDQVVNEIEVRR